MADVIRSGAHQCFGRNTADFHRVIGNQPMPPFNQFNSRFALTYSAVSRQQNTLAVNLDKNTVTGDAGGQLYIKKRDKRRHKSGGRVGRMEERHPVFDAGTL